MIKYYLFVFSKKNQTFNFYLNFETINFEIRNFKMYMLLFN